MPLSAERLIRYAKLVVPADHLGVLVEPPAAQIADELKPHHESLARAPILDTTMAALHANLRQRLELDRPVILTGHQPEFFHAGVFAKTVAAGLLARRYDGIAVFLTVDSDLPRAAQLLLPQTTSGGVRRVAVAIPNLELALPYEAQPATPREHWLQFFARFASMYELYDRSLLRQFAYAWLTSGERLTGCCEAFARARAATEDALGVGGTRELRVSHLCATPEFRVFVASMMLDAARCVTAYNAAQGSFRARHRVRAAGRPVPALVRNADRHELPFWMYRAGEPRRRLFVRERGEAIEILADDNPVDTVGRGDLSSIAAHDEPWPLERDGWMLRPRALTLSAFVRLFLSDLFIHGIGGAKYDEMMEDFIRDLLGVDPRPTCCVTATVRLPLPRHDAKPADIADARQQSRDIRFNPQRHLKDLPPELVRQRAELVRRSTDLRNRTPDDHEARRVVFRAIRRLNDQMLAKDPWRAAEYDRRVEALQQQREVDRIALDREYFYALHPRETLESLLETLTASL
jgi:hypothetical protein